MRPVAVQGLTLGSMGFIFPVKNNGAMHMAATFGGAWLTPGLLNERGEAPGLHLMAATPLAWEEANGGGGPLLSSYPEQPSRL
jgi:hypothetical protein